MRTLVVLLTFCLATFIARAESSDPVPTVAPVASHTMSREERLTTDSAYQRFVLDSIKAVNEADLRMQGMHSDNVEHKFIPFVALLIPIIAIIGFIVVMWRRNESNRQIRLAMIEKGMDPSLLVERTDENSKKYASLRFGLLAAGAGLGIIVGNVLVKTTNIGMDSEEMVILSSVLLFSGAGMVAYHAIARKIERTTPRG